MKIEDHFGAMLQAAQRAWGHQATALLHAETYERTDVPDDVQQRELEAVLRETAQAEAALAEFERLAKAHAEQARVVLRALTVGAGERRLSAVQWSATKASA